MQGNKFASIQWIAPLAVIAAGVCWYLYLHQQHERATIYADDPRLKAAFACAVDDMWEHELKSNQITAIRDDADESGAPPADLLQRAEGGDSQAMFEVGIMLVSRSGVDETTGFDWLMRSAEDGHPDAQNEVGAGFLYGYFGVRPDRRQAHSWLQRAAGTGDVMAMYSLGTSYARSPSGARRREALELHLDAAAGCSAAASRLVASRSMEGRGLPRDRARAQALEMEVREFEKRGGFVH